MVLPQPGRAPFERPPLCFSDDYPRHLLANAITLLHQTPLCQTRGEPGSPWTEHYQSRARAVLSPPPCFSRYLIAQLALLAYSAMRWPLPHQR